MKAVGFLERGLPLSHENALLDLEIPEPPPPAGRDLLVRVKAVSVNPRDVKSRPTIDASRDKPAILGFDASGIVEATGPDVTLFRPGDAVYYAGVPSRQGSNAELQLVDERIVGRKPESLEHVQAAALPLTSLTAYEMLFDRLGIPCDGAPGSCLILGGGGGVPSIAIQLLRILTNKTVIATASRKESEDWVRSLGAHHVVNHSAPLAPQIEALKLAEPLGWIFSTHTTPSAWAEFAGMIEPQGRIGLIDDPEPLDLRPLKRKCASIHWEAMFTRALFKTPDMVRQHDILCEIAGLIDAGKLRATATEIEGVLCAANLRRAYETVETGKVIGKIVLRGYA